MFNLFLIIYFLLLLIFFGGVFVIVYHLTAYKMNDKISTITKTIFLAGVIVLLFINFILAFQVPWDKIYIVF